MIGGVPWKENENDEEADGEGMKVRELTEEEKEEMAEQEHTSHGEWITWR